MLFISLLVECIRQGEVVMYSIDMVIVIGQMKLLIVLSDRFSVVIMNENLLICVMFMLVCMVVCGLWLIVNMFMLYMMVLLMIIMVVIVRVGNMYWVSMVGLIFRLIVMKNSVVNMLCSGLIRCMIFFVLCVLVIIVFIRKVFSVMLNFIQVVSRLVLKYNFSVLISSILLWLKLVM